ncbi:MAG TPA: hypothetical protein VFM61_01210 [Pseudidiomarina sp.]|nr:hypothetical protein [Pseudidiomarina sp.]
MKHLLIILVGLLSINTAVAEPAQLFTLDVKLSHQNVLFAEPSIMLEAGKTGEIAINGTRAFTLKLTVDEQADNTVKITSALDSVYGEMAPVVVAKLNETATISVGDLAIALNVRKAKL